MQVRQEFPGDQTDSEECCQELAMLSCILSARSLYRASKAGALAQRDLVAVWHCDQLLLFIDQVEAEWLLDLVACEVAEA